MSFLIRWPVILTLALCVVSCSKQAKTPEEAFESARKAYLEKNAKRFVSLLTDEAVADIESSIEPIRSAYLRMADQQQAQKAFEPMAKKIGVPVSRLGSLTVEEYIEFAMNSDENDGHGSDASLFPKEIIEKPQILRKEESGDKATLYFTDNHKMLLHKTNKGWQIALDLSQQETSSDEN